VLHFIDGLLCHPDGIANVKRKVVPLRRQVQQVAGMLKAFERPLSRREGRQSTLEPLERARRTAWWLCAGGVDSPALVAREQREP